jgi:hypothetical protein
MSRWWQYYNEVASASGGCSPLEQPPLLRDLAAVEIAQALPRISQTVYKYHWNDFGPRLVSN